MALFCNKPITSMDSRTPIFFMISVSTIKFSFICRACKQLVQLVRMGFHSIREQTKGLNVHCLYSINNFPFLCLTLRGFLHQSPLLK